MPVPDVSGKSIAELVSLEGRVGVITGAGRGIGAGIANRFAEAGADMVLTDLDGDAVGGVAAELSEKWGRRVEARVSDATSEDDITELARSVAEDFGRLDIWVNNAGAYPTTELLDMTGEEWDKVVDLNLRGTFIGSREAGRRMIEAGNGGVIINLASVSGYKGLSPGLAHYTSSKHAVLGLSKSLALELGPEGIRVIALSPTLIATQGVADSREEHEDSGLAEVQDALAEMSPLRRVGVPDDVARCALFAASDLSMLVTGSDVLVDSGLIAL